MTVADGASGKVALGHCLAIGLQDLSIWCYECQHYVTHNKLDPIVKQIQTLKFGGKIDERSETHWTTADDSSNAQVTVRAGQPMNGVKWQAMHGFMGEEDWEPPRVITASGMAARPGYDTCSASEYKDTPEVLRAKVKYLAEMVRQSKNCLAYTGAGISTAAGIGDYASVASDSVVKTESDEAAKVSPWNALPTRAHNVLTQMYHGGLLKHWVNQNHDGLPQKAGFPQSALNEIHGAWFDVSNPVVPMSGTLREDLIEWLLEWEKKTDLCLAMGSSLCGMNADRLVESPARRAQAGDGWGAAIVSLQQTRFDHMASLRIFGQTDEVMELLAQELQLPTCAYALDYSSLKDKDVFRLTDYNPRGQRSPGCGGIVLDLRTGQHVFIVKQPEWDRKRRGETGLVVGKTSDGDYMISIGGVTRTLGRWWIREALLGQVPSIPIVNCKEWSK